MVRIIYITSQKHFISPNRMISSINNYGISSNFEINNEYNKFVYCFNDWTTNFTDLLYWDTNLDLNNKTIKTVLRKLSVAISKLQKENITPKIHNLEFLLPDWWFGTKRISSNSILKMDMSDEERKPILMLHLLNMYSELLNIHKKNKIFYCYVC